MIRSVLLQLACISRSSDFIGIFLAWSNFQQAFPLYSAKLLIILSTELFCRFPLTTISPQKEVPLPDSADRRVTSEQVLEVLQTCYDPCCKERSVSVVELGLIQGVEVAENGLDVRIELLLTSGWCPFSTHLLQTSW